MTPQAAEALGTILLEIAKQSPAIALLMGFIWALLNGKIVVGSAHADLKADRDNQRTFYDNKLAEQRSFYEKIIEDQQAGFNERANKLEAHVVRLEDGLFKLARVNEIVAEAATGVSANAR